jgi:hypothetical protein
LKFGFDEDTATILNVKQYQKSGESSTAKSSEMRFEIRAVNREKYGAENTHNDGRQ